MIKYLLIALMLQANPFVNWKSEVKTTAEGNQIVLTGDIKEGVDHIEGTVDVIPCMGTNCYSPEYFEFEHYIKAGSAPSAPAAQLGAAPVATPFAAPAEPLKVEQPKEAVEASTTEQQSAGSLWALIIEAILWGFAMLLTPCVFPMVPMKRP